MQAAFNASAAIQAGHLDVVVAAGVESMSRVPMGSNLGADGWSGLNQKIAERWPIVPQGISAEEIAKEWNISREQLDAYSLESTMRAIAAIDGGQFEQEIVPVDAPGRRDVRGRRGAAPRHVGRAARGAQAGIHRGRARHGRQLEPDRRRRCRDARRQRGCCRPARADAAGAVRLVRASPASIRIRMLHGNPQACAQALDARRARLGRHRRDRGQRGLRLGRAADARRHATSHERWEAGDVNPNGGGISIGHPLGATGARITATLLAELERRDARYGLACMCIGQGQAIAAVIERL